MTIRIGTDNAEKKVLHDVAEYGWHCLSILEEDGYPPFSFSIGLYKTWQFPELLIVGLKREVAHGVLNIVATDLAKGNRPDLAASNQDLLDCVALRWQIFDTGPGCTVLDATDSPWAIDSLLGRMLSRAEALSSGRAKDAFAVTDAVWDSDARLLKAVNGS